MRSLRFLAAALLLAGCGGAADLLSPGAEGPLPARLALEMRLQAPVQEGAVSLRVAATYDRADGTRAPLATQALVLSGARTQDVPLSIDLGPCLADPQRSALAVDGQPACAVRLTLTLLLDQQRVLDEQTVGAYALRPGVTLAPGAPVTLYEVRGVAVIPPDTVVLLRPEGIVRLEVGTTSALTALAVDPAGVPLPGRTATWRTSNAAVLTVSNAGVVTGVAAGAARVTATINGREGSIDYAVFQKTNIITVVAGGAGNGTIRSTPAGIECRVVGGQPQLGCSFAFPIDVPVTLQAVRQQGSAFVGWGEACAAAGTADRCTLTADQPRTVRAIFAPERALAVTNTGDGAGVVGSVPGGISCRFAPEPTGACAGAFAEGASVTLTAAGTAPDAFAGWGGACEGTTAPTCTVTAGAAAAGVSVRFVRPQPLSVDVGGTGDGSVTGGPIACARRLGANTGTCTATPAANALVTLVAAPEANSTFAGWTGDCAGAGACEVRVDRARRVGATFTRRQVTLAVALSGAGAGAVVVDGQRCALGAGQGSQSCALRVDVARPLALSTEPATGSEFGTWGGACAASARTPTCTLTLDADASVGATFVPGAVRVTIGGDANTTGGGTVATPAGAEPRIACTVRGATATGSCDAPVPVGATLVLDAAPDANSTFGSWTGACAGTAGPRCTFTVRAAAAVGVRFLRQQSTLAIALTGTGGGTLTLNGAPACALTAGQGSASCARLVDLGTTLTLTLAPAPGSAAQAWSGACANVSSPSAPCTVAVSGTTVSVGGAFLNTSNVLRVRPAPGFRGGGRVQSGDTLVDCTIAPNTGATSGRCDVSYAPGAQVTLSLTSFTMSQFRGGWSGLCATTSTSCSVVVPPGGGVATITLPEQVAVGIAGSGQGSVFVDSSSQSYALTPSVQGPPGTFTFFEGQTARLFASSVAAGGFRQWGGLCAASGNASLCTFTVPVGSATGGSVGATFDFAVPVRVGNDAGGTVTVQGITGPNTVCTRPNGGFTDCVLRAPAVTVTLAATPVPGSVFDGWNIAACGTSPTCSVDLRTLVGQVVANFGPEELALLRSVRPKSAKP